MTRSPLVRRIALLASISGAAAFSGCPAAEERPATDSGSPTTEADIETLEVAEKSESVSVADPAAPTGASGDSIPLTMDDPVEVGPDGSSANAAPAVAIERPRDFLRPTLPDAVLETQETEEAADPPEAVSDRSAEAEDPLVLPGGAAVDDLFEGLEEKPSADSND